MHTNSLSLIVHVLCVHVYISIEKRIHFPVLWVTIINQLSPLMLIF